MRILLMPSRSIAHRQSAPRRYRMTAGYRLFLGLPFNLWAIVYLYLTSDNLPYEKIGNNEPVSIADEIPFDIPDSWEWVRLGAVIELQSGQDMTPDKYNDCGKGIPYITGASNIENGNVLINRWTEYGRAFAYFGDILLTCKGTVGTMAVLQEPQVHIARQIMAVRPISELYVPYLQLVLDTLVENLKAAAKSMIPGIARENVLQSLFPVPPVSEQKRIVQKVSELSPCLEQYAAADTKLLSLNAVFPEALKKSILQEAVQGKLVPQDPSDEPAEDLLERIRAEKQRLIKEGKIKKDKHESVIFRRDNSHYEKLDGVERCIDDELPFEIPESWAWVRLGTVLEIARGGSPRPIQQYLTTESNGVNWIKIGDADNGGKYIYKTKEKICPEGVTKSRMVHSGDFLLTNSMSFGRPYILKTDGCIHDGWLVLSNRFECYSVDFLYYILSSPFAYYQFCDSVSGAVVKNLNSDKVANALFPLPPLSEQCRIIQRIEKLLPLVKRL